MLCDRSGAMQQPRAPARCWLATLALVSVTTAVSGAVAAQDERKLESLYPFKKLQLTVDMAALGELSSRMNTEPWCPGEWWGKHGSHSLFVKLEAYDRAKFARIHEPEDVLGTIVYNLLKEEDKRSRWQFSDRKHVGGSVEHGGVFGYVPYAIVGSSPFEQVDAKLHKTKDGISFVLCGVLKGWGAQRALHEHADPGGFPRQRAGGQARFGWRRAAQHQLASPYWP